MRAALLGGARLSNSVASATTWARFHQSRCNLLETPMGDRYVEHESITVDWQTKGRGTQRKIYASTGKHEVAALAAQVRQCTQPVGRFNHQLLKTFERRVLATRAQQLLNIGFASPLNPPPNGSSETIAS